MENEQAETLLGCTINTIWLAMDECPDGTTDEMIVEFVIDVMSNECYYLNDATIAYAKSEKYRAIIASMIAVYREVGTHG